MKVKRIFSKGSVENAEGLTIVVDILRAATLEAFLLAQGASSILPVTTVEEAFQIKKDQPHVLLAGEEHGLPIDGFDYGNSPFQVRHIDFTGKVVVHRTTNGTRQLREAHHANGLLVGSLVNLTATYLYAVRENPEVVTIVGGEHEDVLFADAFEAMVKKGHINKKKLQEDLLTYPSAKHFRDPAKTDFPIEDLQLAAQVDRFDFVCLVTRDNGMLVTRRKKSTP